MSFGLRPVGPLRVFSFRCQWNQWSKMQCMSPSMSHSFATSPVPRREDASVPRFHAFAGSHTSYNPWSKTFRGTNHKAILLQSLVYSSCLMIMFELVRPDNSVTQEKLEKIKSGIRDLKEINTKLMTANKILQKLAQSQLQELENDAPTYANSEQLQEAIALLKSTFPGKGYIKTDMRSLLKSGASFTSYLPDVPHAIIVRPLCTEDVVKVVNIARKYRVPLIPTGGSTSFEGHFTGHSAGSICLDMSRMNKIIKINAEDGDLVCQAGAKWEHINQILRNEDIPLFFPLDPGPGATIGGMINTGCSGPNSAKYGSARAEWFLNVTVVLPNGDIVKTRQRARNSATGLDSTKLFVGAEGTLGIITQATIRLAPVVSHRVAISQFPNIGQAANAVQEILGSPLASHIQCVELLDDQMMQAIADSGVLLSPEPVEDTVLFKIQGDPETIKSTSVAMKAIVEKHQTSSYRVAATEEESEDLWKNRKHIFLSTMMSDPEAQCWMTDVCVPVSKLPLLVQETKDDLKENGLTSTIFGHIGNGNFHALILFNGEDEFKAASQVVHRMAKRAIALDGSCTGEHGIGLAKRQYLDDELGSGTVDLMRTIKRALDPLDILNPGKLYPDLPLPTTFRQANDKKAKGMQGIKSQPKQDADFADVTTQQSVPKA